MSRHNTEVSHLYEEIADWFNTQRTSFHGEQPYLEAALKYVPANGTVLDLGCGTGQPIAEYLIAQGMTVTGVDIAPRMIPLCKQRFPDQTWLTSDIRTLDLGRQFNAIIAWDSFFHLTGDAQRAMFPVFERHTAPGGALIFTSGTSEGAVYGNMQGHDVHHASLDPHEYRDLLAKHGFQVILHKIEDPDCGHHTVWVTQKEKDT